MGYRWVVQESMEHACEGLLSRSRESSRHPKEWGARDVCRGSPTKAKAEILVNVVEPIPRRTGEKEAGGIVLSRMRDVADAQVRGQRP